MRTERHSDEIIPDWAAGLGGLLMVATLAATGYAVLTAPEAPATPAPVTAAAPIDSRALTFRAEDAASGAVTVIDAASGAVVADLGEDEGGFVSGVLRVMTRERAQRAIGAEAPFRLTAYADGRLSLTDPATGRVIDINAFGRTQAETFAALL